MRCRSAAGISPSCEAQAECQCEVRGASGCGEPPAASRRVRGAGCAAVQPRAARTESLPWTKFAVNTSKVDKYCGKYVETPSQLDKYCGKHENPAKNAC